jgi:hypothetical protein
LLFGFEWSAIKEVAHTESMITVERYAAREQGLNNSYGFGLWGILGLDESSFSEIEFKAKE